MPERDKPKLEMYPRRSAARYRRLARLYRRVGTKVDPSYARFLSWLDGNVIVTDPALQRALILDVEMPGIEQTTPEEINLIPGDSIGIGIELTPGDTKGAPSIEPE